MQVIRTLDKNGINLQLKESLRKHSVERGNNVKPSYPDVMLRFIFFGHRWLRARRRTVHYSQRVQTQWPATVFVILYDHFKDPFTVAQYFCTSIARIYGRRSIEKHLYPSS